jgi:hypothetical protein
MLVKELRELEEGCKEQCPLYDEFCPGGMACYGGDPIEPPCMYWDDENEDVDDIYHRMFMSRIRYEEAEDKKYKREQEAKKKKEEKAKKARDARWHVRTEQREITSLRRRIRSNKKLLSFANSWATATNITNEMFGYEERLEIKKKNPLEIENEKLQARIDELDKIKKEKLKQFRAKRKESENK